MTRDGRVRWAFRRILLHKNGSPRDFLPEDMRQLLRSASIEAWVGRHGLPKVATQRPDKRRVLLVSDPSKEEASAVSRNHDWALEGLEVMTSGSLDNAADTDLCDTAECALVIGATATPRPGGPATLVHALLTSRGATLAYGDELFRDHSGQIIDHWFKPDTTDPLLAERGVLFGGLVALNTRHKPAARAVRALLRGDRPIREVLADLGRELPPEAAVHVPGAVVEDEYPRPAALPRPPQPELVDLPTASILIPTRNRWDMLGPCLDSLASTEWPDVRLEILVIDNGSDDPETLAELHAAEDAGKIRVLRDDRPFNYAALNNAGARAATGDLLVLLNNDTVALRADWLERLAQYALRPDAGAVGCKLLYPDDTVQHAGVVLGYRRGGRHVGLGLAADEGGYNELANIDRRVSAVTGACLAVRREAFDAVGGLNDAFKVSYNDVVFCADLQKAGYHNYYVADALFHHFESKSRGRDDSPAKKALATSELALARELHPDLFAQDPYYSPCLSQKVLFELLEPPRLP